MPLIIVLSLESILPALEHYIKQLERRVENIPLPNPSLTTMLTHATAQAPMRPLSVHEANLLSCICPSIRDLEEATRTSNGRERIISSMGLTTAQYILEFWEDEWIA